MLECGGDDRYITQQTLLEFGTDITIKFSSNSIEFFDLLSKGQEPVLILVDYNSIPENGLDVLKKLKSDPNLCDIPVVILSDSDFPKYKNECYQYGASSFIKKPDALEATNKKIASFFTYWFNVVEV